MEAKAKTDFDILCENISFPAWIYHRSKYSILAANKPALEYFGLLEDEINSGVITEFRNKNGTFESSVGSDILDFTTIVSELLSYNQSSSRVKKSKIISFEFNHQGEDHSLEIYKPNGTVKEVQISSSGNYSTSIIENAPIGIYRCNLNGMFIAANATFCKFAGYKSIEELNNKGGMDALFLSEEDSSAFLNSLLQNGKYFNLEHIWQTGAGEKINILHHLMLVRNLGGEAVGFEGTVENITDKKLNEQNLRGSIRRYNGLAASIKQMVWNITPKGEAIGEFPGWEAFTGQSKKECQGRGWMQAVHAGDRYKVAKEWVKANSSGSVYKVRLRIKRADGIYNTFEARGVPIINAEGQVTEQVGTCTQVQEMFSKDIEHNIFLNLDKFTKDAVFSINLNNEVQSWNSGAEQLFGYSFKEVNGKPVTDLKISKSPEGEVCIHCEDDSFFTPELTEAIWYSKTGHEVPVAYTRYPVVDGAGTLNGCIYAARDNKKVRDLEEKVKHLIARDQNSQRLRGRNAIRLRFLSEAGKLLNESFDKQGILSTFAKLVTREICDWCIIEILDLDGELKVMAVEHFNHEKVLAAHHLHDKYPLHENLRKSTKHIMQRKKMDVYPEITDDLVRSFAENDEHFAMMQAMGVKSAIVVPLLSRGETLGVITFLSESPLSKNAILTKDFSQEIAIRASIAVYKTNLYEELNKLNRELEQRVQKRTEQLEAANKELETFSYSVSHDLRAPLRAIDGFAGFLEEDYSASLDEEGKRYLSVIKENATQMGKLIDDLLAFSRMSRARMQVSKLNISEMVHGIYKDLTYSLTERKIELKAEAIPSCKADLALIKQVWINLISNAVKYSGKTEHAIIEISGEENETDWIYKIKDNGIGFDMKYQEKLFGVFQRLHKAADFEGTGVGLALVHRIIARHGGTISAHGEPNKGAEFIFTIPKDPAL